MNSYAETGGGFNSNHGQTARPAETQKHQNISSTWSYNGQLEGMYYGGEHQPMFVGPYDGTSKHANYPQYPAGTLHQPVPTPVVKCNEACCQHFQDRYPLNPAPLRYQPGGPVQPRYADLPNPDTRQYFTDRRTMPSLSRKKVYAENGYPGISDRRFPQYVGRGQLHLDSRQQMQMMRAQYPMYPPYWGSARGWTGPRMNCPPPPSYHQSINQGAQLKMADGSHYIDPTVQKSFSTQHRRAVGTGGGTDLIRPVPDPKRTALDPNSQSCYEFGYPTGFVPFSEVNKIQGGSLTSQGSNASCKIPNEKQYHPHQMQYAMQSGDRNLMNCGNPINDLSYSMNFPLPGNDAYMRSGLEDGQSIADSRKMQYDSLSKKRPDLDLRQYLATWEDDEDESTRMPEALALGNNGAPYIVVDCRSLEGEAAAKLQERFKTPQVSSSKSRSNSPNSEQKQSDEPSRKNESSERTEGPPDFQNQASYAPSMPTLLTDTDKSLWNSLNRDDQGLIGKGAFQPLDCSKRDSNQDIKRDSHPHSDLPVQKIPGTNENANMTLDALVSYYGDNRRVVDGGYDFVEMTERLVNNIDKTPLNNRSHMDHSLSSEPSRPCDPRLQQSQLGNNPSIYNKVSSRYPTTNYQHYKSGMHTDPYYNYKHPISSNKFFGYDNPQTVDPNNYEYHKIAAEFDNSRLYGSKDVSKDPRRMFHQEIDKNVESAFYDPIRKPLTDCFQDKANLEFASVDPEQFINPAAIKKSLDPREKLYSDKNHVIRDRMDSLNNTSQTQSEKTVLITSQNGPPEIFRVPFSPDKEMSLKDNVVTLHAGDQNKSSTMTVEVPYVQQYSTLVKLSEEISRAEKNEVQSTECSDIMPNKKSIVDDFKKPASFKLKRVPNSKEWTVEGKECGGSTPTTDIAECESATLTSSSCEIETRDLKQSGAVSSLNMPSLDDIRDGEENRNLIEEHQSKNKPNDGVLSSSKICSTSDETNKTKYNVQTPQMAIVQPMKMNQSNNEALNASCDGNSKLLDGVSEKTIGKGDSNLKYQGDSNSKEVELSTDNDISKHGNFRAHKKIQSGFTNALPNCIVSSNDDFLHSQDLNTSESKETYSPFHVFPECDVNSQLSDYFKIHDRNSGEKILDSSSRVPSSPGVDAMFEDINNSNQNQIYPTKSCNFHDLTDPNVSLTNHNSHFQSFSSIFSDESDKIGRPDGSVLQMNDKKYLKNMFDDIGHHDQEDKLLETSILNEVDSTKSDETKKSPPIPTISLKLNETKKMWCIANKDDSSVSDDSNERMSVESPKSTINHCQDDLTGDTVSGLESDLARALQEESARSFSKKYKSLEVPSTLLDLNENEQNTCCESQNESDLNKLICEEIDKHNSDSLSNILEIDYRRNYSLVLEETSHFGKENLNQLQNANKCRSLVKYCPRNKVCNQNSLKCTDKYKTLIFDENGQDFTQQSYLEATCVDNAHSFVQDLLYNLISKSVDICEYNNKATDALFDFNEPDKVKLNYEYSSSEKGNAHTVIKFDSSGHQNKAYKIQDSILTTTKSFIQHEKETCNNSVIKVVQSENFNDKKIIRSIFSPQSEDGDQEDIIKSKDIDNALEIDKEDSNNVVCLMNNKQALDLSYKRKHTDNSTCDKVKNCKMNQHSTSIRCSNDINEEGSKEFCSSKINHLIPQSFHNSTKDNLEIDEALELMGLATSKPIGIETKNDDNIAASLCEDLVDEGLKLLHDSLESEDGQQFSSDETRKNKNMQITSNKPDACPETEQETTISKKVSANVCSQTLTHDASKPEGEGSSLNSTKIDSSCLFGNSDTYEHNIEKGSQPELCSSMSESVEQKDLGISKSSKISDLDITTNKMDYPSSVNVICSDELSSQEHVKRKCNGENTTKEMPPTKFIKTCDVESEANCCGKWENFNANIKHMSEDIESRLEMSVIVRNKSCSSRVYKGEISGLIINEINREEHDNLLQNGLEPEYKDLIISVDSCTQIPKANETAGDLESNNNPLSLNPSSHTKITSTSVYLDPCTDSTMAVENIIQTADSKDTKSSANLNLSYKTPGNFFANSTSEIKTVSIEPPYCSGESIFLGIDETSSYLENSRLSYFYEFKKRKWQRYCKPSLSFINNEHCAHTNNMLNPCSVKNLKSSKANANGPVSSDNNQEGSFVIVPLTNNNQDIVKLAGNEDLTSLESQETLTDKAPSLMCKGKQSFCVRRDSLKVLEPEAVLKEIFSPDSASDDSESKENECPIDVKLQIKQFNDAEPISHPNQTSIIQYNSATLANKLKDASSLLHSEKNETLSVPFGKPDSELLSQYKKQDHSATIQLEKGETALGPSTFKSQIVTPNVESESLNEESSDLIDISTFQPKIVDDKSNSKSCQDGLTSVNYPTESNETHKSVIYSGSDSICDTFESTCPTHSGIKDLHMTSNTQISTILKSLGSPDCSDSVETHQQPVTVSKLLSSHNLHENTDVGLSSSESSDNINNLTISYLGDQSENISSFTKEYTNSKVTDENKVDSSKINNDESIVGTLDLVEIESRPKDNTGGPTKTNGDSIGILDINNVMPSDSPRPNLEMEKGAITLIGCVSSSPTESRTSLEQRQSNSLDHCQVSKCGALNFSNDPNPTSDKNEEIQRLNGFTINDELNQEMCNERGENVATIDKNHVKENQLFSSEHNKATDNHNILKINSVQDSLIHNHNLNKENPLQCLVEAALALENVESNILNNNIERTSNSETLSDVKNNTQKNNNEDSCQEESILTPADKEIFSKFEETNYNLRASTRIVTSSSSNIIPYPKRKYTLKSSKFSSGKSENKTKTPDHPGIEKCRSKKRKCGFTYPRSKRRKKVTKSKADLQSERFGDESINTHASDCEFSCDTNKTQAVENITKKDDHIVVPLEKSEDLNSNSRSCLTSNSDNDFGGPLIIANSPNSNEGNVLCVQVNSNKMDEYVNNINLGDLEVMTETQSLFKESSVGVDSSSDQTLENSTSLVIIFENLDDDNSDKVHLEERKKEESDSILESMDKTCSVLCLPQPDSTLDDCAELLNTEFSANESCICPSELKMKLDTDRTVLKNNQYKSIERDTLMSKSSYDVEDNYRKYSIAGNQELLTASCYEELNENLVNDIGNWPFVEEEVAEFNDKIELPNNIPEEGRKIELKCSLPWKKIFNISRKKKSKESKKVSGLELGPAKVEVRLRAPSSEWKVISDFYDNASPVVKVKRLILQRDSDLSSFSEKDSEEENEQKRKVLSNNTTDRMSHLEPNPVDNNMTVTNEVLTNVTVDEHWQPVVVLKRIENLDEINITLEKEIPPQDPPSPCTSSQSSFSCDEKSSHNFSHSENEASDDMSVCSHHSGGSEAASEQSEICLITDKREDNEKYDSCVNETPAKNQAYETYSPSNCNNTFTGDKLYSPSDPHFSPENRCNDSENNSSSESMSYNDFSSDEEDQWVKQTSSKYLIDAVMQKESVTLEVSDLNQEQGSLESNNNYSQNKEVEVDTDLQQKEDREIIEPHNHGTSEKSTSLPDISESPKLTETLNCLSSGSSTFIESELPNNNVVEPIIYLENADTSPSKENYESSKEASDTSVDAKQNIKRKMPKNFFVRRRLKKHISYNDSPYKYSHVVEGNTGPPVRPFTFSSTYDSMSDPPVVINQRDPTSFQTSSGSKNEKSSGNNVHQSISESDISLVGDSARLQSAYDLEASSPARRNESPSIERFEVKQRLRDGGRGLKRPSEGHSKGDTKRRRKKLKNSNRCQECKIQFENKEELVRHNAYRHARRRELHHCLLCQRSFSSAVRHSLHVQGRSHRHIELTQRHTMHAMHHLLVGGEFPLIPTLSRAELRTLQWRPSQLGYAHFYHQLTPLQAALQEHNTDVSEDTLSEDRMPND